MEEKSRKPEDTPFKQQKLKAWQPILTPNWVIGTFAFVGLLFIPIGVILHIESSNVVEYSVQYDAKDMTSNPSISGNCSLENEADGNQFNVGTNGCYITFDIEEDMEAPVYVYYQLDNFYQNHRRYVQSRSDAQLRGDASANTGDCAPMETTSGVVKYDSTLETPPLSSNTSKVYNLNPCGLIANSMFNDIIWVHSVKFPSDDVARVSTADDTTVQNLMSQSSIAWKSDIETKFKNIPEEDRNNEDDLFLWQNPNYRYIIPERVGQPPEFQKTAWTQDSVAYGVQDEHFIVWMRTAGLPNFRKLYGRIDTNLEKGTTITFLVSCNFVVQTFDGKKHLVLSTTSWFGGRNPFLGIAYVAVGSLCMVLAILFFAKHKLSPRKLGDTRYLVWKNNQ